MSVDGRDDERPPAPGEAALDPVEGAKRRAETKRRFLEAALERGKSQVRIDARRPGVRVPPRFETETSLALNLSWRFPDARMVVNERGIAATLKFSGEPHRCVIPWRAVWGVLAPGDDTVQVWPMDLPPELGGPPIDENEPEPLPVEPVAPRLVAVSGGLDAVESLPAVESPPAPVVAERPSGGIRVVSPVETPSPVVAPVAAVDRDDAGTPTTPPRRGHLRVVK